jgi:hypothetical protein
MVVAIAMSIVTALAVTGPANAAQSGSWRTWSEKIASKMATRVATPGPVRGSHIGTIPPGSKVGPPRYVNKDGTVTSKPTSPNGYELYGYMVCLLNDSTRCVGEHSTPGNVTQELVLAYSTAGAAWLPLIIQFVRSKTARSWAMKLRALWKGAGKHTGFIEPAPAAGKCEGVFQWKAQVGLDRCSDRHGIWWNWNFTSKYGARVEDTFTHGDMITYGTSEPDRVVDASPEPGRWYTWEIDSVYVET